MMKVTISDTGYVGLSNAVILAQHHQITVVDIVPEKVAMNNDRISLIQDIELECFIGAQRT